MFKVRKCTVTKTYNHFGKDGSNTAPKSLEKTNLPLSSIASSLTTVCELRRRLLAGLRGICPIRVRYILAIDQS